MLFLDVDGPLIPFGARLPIPGDRRGAADSSGSANPLLARLDPRDGRRLLALGCDLVWATSWSTDANEVIAPRLGLPPLPVVAWSDAADEGPAGLHWKTRDLVAWAAGRRFVWIDDEISGADRAWIAAHSPAPALAHRVDPGSGLTAADFTAVGAWLARAGEASAIAPADPGGLRSPSRAE
ncbi:HAD domain-containing protein [Dactylosporangium sp. NPDC000555]|uniref:HAD domain-containing protein n=1 Tax=Dactylosporangium sp. NPDC000555 TaxID=3154260 RepID=UPI003322B45E